MSEGHEQIEREIAEGNMVADQLQTLMKENGLEPESREATVFKKLINVLRGGGKAQARIFLNNEFDKFRSTKFERSVAIPFFETHIFDAGEDRLQKETPWNSFERMKARIK